MSVALALGALGAAGISALAGGIGSANDRNANLSISKKNLQFQKEQLDYQKALQQQIFEREDTAVQRRKNDLLNAGMNPYLSETQPGAGAGSVVSTSAPQINYQENLGKSISGNIQNSIGQIFDTFNAVQKIKQEELYTKYMQLQNQMALLGYNDAMNQYLVDWTYFDDNNQAYPYYQSNTKRYDYLQQTNRFKQRDLMLNSLSFDNQLRQKDIDFYVADRIEKYLMDSISGFSKYSFTKNYRRR